MTDTPLQNSASKNQPARVSHSLALVAGNLADEIAELWPFPHSEFLERSSPWMHIAGIVVANRAASNHNARLIFDTARCWSAATEGADPRFNQNNRSVLKSLALPLWTKRQYRCLVDVIECPNSLKALRHQSVISPELVLKLHALPKQLRVASVLRHIRNEHEAKILARIGATSHGKQSALLSKVSSADSERDFWKKASSFFVDRCVQFPQPPTIDDERVKPILSVDELRSLGREMRLCLWSFVGEALAGEKAFYLFRGGEKVVISISPRIHGAPVIDQMSAYDNKPVSDGDRSEIILVFKRMGFFDESGFVDDWPTELDRRLTRLGLKSESEIDEQRYSKINTLIDGGLQASKAAPFCEPC